MNDVLPKMDRMIRQAAHDHSPCVGHCTYDADDFCLSCRRHTDEIGAWRDADEALRLAAWGRIPAAIDAAGLDVMRLPLSPDDILILALEALDHGGAWAVTAGGITAYAHDLIADNDGVASAISADGQTEITFDLSGKMRALAWTRQEATGRSLADDLHDLPILLVVPKVRLNLPVYEEPTALDDGRIDCGLGRADCRALTDGDDLMIETMLATARIKNGAGLKPSLMPSDQSIIKGLDLPESYALAAAVLPKGEADL